MFLFFRNSSKMGPMLKDELRKYKYISLLTLTFQNALLGLSMRYSRTREGDMFYSGTAVLMAEVVKFLTCLGLVYKEEQYNSRAWMNTLYTTVYINWKDTLKVGVQNFL